MPGLGEIASMLSHTTLHSCYSMYACLIPGSMLDRSRPWLNLRARGTRPQHSMNSKLVVGLCIISSVSMFRTLAGIFISGAEGQD